MAGRNKRRETCKYPITSIGFNVTLITQYLTGYVVQYSAYMRERLAVCGVFVSRPIHRVKLTKRLTRHLYRALRTYLENSRVSPE